MDSVKLRFKIGPHEFEAEGPPDVVASYFAQWQSQVNAPLTEQLDRPKRTPVIDDEVISVAPAAVDALEESPAANDWRLPKHHLAQLFAEDGKRGIVRLRALPRPGQGHQGRTILLALYGALRLRQEDEVPVTRLLAALEASGVRTDRIDRSAATELRERLITKSGSGKGNRYRLTSTGIAQAEEIGSELAKQFVAD
jgi:hypothetical protein